MEQEINKLKINLKNLSSDIKSINSFLKINQDKFTDYDILFKSNGKLDEVDKLLKDLIIYYCKK
jgi:hypothetical protein